mmetsp:Transcript_33887/g.107059  ORF Transcript_33887/g.107059 Transcript_33887/m.107059 type:complete len:625 (-) Transcript_33887:1031-2905(-)
MDGTATVSTGEFSIPVASIDEDASMGSLSSEERERMSPFRTDKTSIDSAAQLDALYISRHSGAERLAEDMDENAARPSALGAGRSPTPVTDPESSYRKYISYESTGGVRSINDGPRPRSLSSMHSTQSGVKRPPAFRVTRTSAPVKGTRSYAHVKGDGLTEDDAHAMAMDLMHREDFSLPGYLRRVKKTRQARRAGARKKKGIIVQESGSFAHSASTGALGTRPRWLPNNALGGRHLNRTRGGVRQKPQLEAELDLGPIFASVNLTQPASKELVPGIPVPTRVGGADVLEVRLPTDATMAETPLKPADDGPGGGAAIEEVAAEPEPQERLLTPKAFRGVEDLSEVRSHISSIAEGSAWVGTDSKARARSRSTAATTKKIVICLESSNAQPSSVSGTYTMSRSRSGSATPQNGEDAAVETIAEGEAPGNAAIVRSQQSESSRSYMEQYEDQERRRQVATAERLTQPPAGPLPHLVHDQLRGWKVSAATLSKRRALSRASLRRPRTVAGTTRGHMHPVVPASERLHQRMYLAEKDSIRRLGPKRPGDLLDAEIQKHKLRLAEREKKKRQQKKRQAEEAARVANVADEIQSPGSDWKRCAAPPSPLASSRLESRLEASLGDDDSQGI